MIKTNKNPQLSHLIKIEFQAYKSFHHFSTCPLSDSELLLYGRMFMQQMPQNSKLNCHQCRSCCCFFFPSFYQRARCNREGKKYNKELLKYHVEQCTIIALHISGTCILIDTLIQCVDIVMDMSCNDTNEFKLKSYRQHKTRNTKIIKLKLNKDAPAQTLLHSIAFWVMSNCFFIVLIKQQLFLFFYLTNCYLSM